NRREGSDTLTDGVDLSQLQQIDDAKPTCQTPADREHASGGAADLADLTSRPHWEGEAAVGRRRWLEEGEIAMTTTCASGGRWRVCDGNDACKWRRMARRGA
ncbi:Os03g0104901, partial [Oryza sativa Japonica Group]